MFDVEEFSSFDEGISCLSELVSDAKGDILYIGGEELFKEFITGKLNQPLLNSFENWKSLVDLKVKKMKNIEAKSKILAKLCRPFMSNYPSRFEVTLQTPEHVINEYREQIAGIKNIINPIEIYSVEKEPDTDYCFVDSNNVWMWNKVQPPIKCSGNYLFSRYHYIANKKIGRVYIVASI